jgi:hypothetical protein
LGKANLCGSEKWESRLHRGMKIRHNDAEKQNMAVRILEYICLAEYADRKRITERSRDINYFSIKERRGWVLWKLVV